jgi:hypothetical protein
MCVRDILCFGERKGKKVWRCLTPCKSNCCVDGSMGLCGRGWLSLRFSVKLNNGYLASNMYKLDQTKRCDYENDKKRF